MVEKLVELIEGENPRRPFTDEELAGRMKVHRERIMELRMQAGIPDSRERLRRALIPEFRQLSAARPGLSERAMTAALNQMGYEVSRYLVKRLREELSRERSGEAFGSGDTLGGGDTLGIRGPFGSGDAPVSEAAPSGAKSPERGKSTPGRSAREGGEEDVFCGVIGFDGGLKNQINQAKAAVLYPPSGLNTLIIGASGSGKTFLAETMYRFALQKKVLEAGAPFVVFNCADYAENPQLLISQLFGYVKGAFSGAKENKRGLVEEADGGILFLDEVHRLPNEGQELLFYLLDKGEFRRLGDSGPPRRVKVRVIAATTENPESSLLLTFRRRIPMIISMPCLKERPIEERYVIIRTFLGREARQIRRQLVVEWPVVAALLTYPCSGNVGQLRSDIQVLCAEAFLASVSMGRPKVRIKAEQLKGALEDSCGSSGAVSARIPGFGRDLTITPEGGSDEGTEAADCAEAESLYQLIETAFEELGGRELGQEEVLEQVQSRINRYLNLPEPGQDCPSKTSLETFVENMVDRRLVEATRRGIDLAKREFPRLQDDLYSLLAIHLEAVLNNLKAGSYSASADTARIRRENSREYQVALAMVAQISKELDAAIPVEEAARITVYLKTFRSRIQSRPKRIRVIILTHGQVGVSMAEVVNAVMDMDLAVGVAMGLTESYQVALNRVIELAGVVDEGKGILLLVDMGSLTEIGDAVMEKTGIPVRSIARVDTLMALDAVRRASLEDASLDEVAQAIRWSQGFPAEPARTGEGLKPALITVCLTGEGNARRLKGYLESSVLNASDDIAIFEIGLLNAQRQREEIDRIRREYHILAITGTMDPEVPGIPFYPMGYVFSSQGLLALMGLISEYQGQKTSLIDVVRPELILFEPEPTITKNEIIDGLCASMETAGAVTDGFLLSVYKREMMGSTCMTQEKIAVPHGDSAFVTKPAIAVAKLAKPVVWSEDNVADLVFLFAFDNSCRKYAEKFSQLTEEKQRISNIRGARSKEEILKYLNF